MNILFRFNKSFSTLFQFIPIYVLIFIFLMVYFIIYGYSLFMIDNFLHGKFFFANMTLCNIFIIDKCKQ